MGFRLRGEGKLIGVLEGFNCFLCKMWSGFSVITRGPFILCDGLASSWALWDVRVRRTATETYRTFVDAV